jgi:hypothetical protein
MPIDTRTQIIGGTVTAATLAAALIALAVAGGGPADAKAMDAAQQQAWATVNDDLPAVGAIPEAVAEVERLRQSVALAEVALAEQRAQLADAEAKLAALQAGAPALRERLASAVQALADAPPDIRGSGQVRAVAAAVDGPTEARTLEVMDPVLAAEVVRAKAAPVEMVAP